MDSRTIVIFGAELDIRLLRQTAAAHKDAALWLDASDIHCAMRLAAP
ncbi:putative plasmid protein [Salmonella enterica subsp. enterica serovar Muenchen str. baa1594]|nr:putative plasmid protein [Salmonella enterica subsp. enterica serovar Muenchen str. baa1594]